jgi:hypothetical protein
MTVYANGREIASKTSNNKTIAAMPDVCLSPPAPPAGPVPIPYPNTASALDTHEGTSSVRIRNKPVMMKNRSSFKKSIGDQAATNNFGANIITHNLGGPAKFAAYSFDVKVEGANVCRHGDLTTHNHANPGGGASGFDIAKQDSTIEKPKDCEDLEGKNNSDREAFKNNKKLSGPGTTNTNYKFVQPNKDPVYRAAHNSVAAVGRLDGKFDEGMPASERRGNEEGKSSVNCKGQQTFRYNNCLFDGGHTEARIIETLFKNSVEGRLSGVLTLKIDWHKSNGKKSCAPCEKCHALLCAASQCGLGVIICTEDNKKVPLQEDDCLKNLNLKKKPQNKKVLMNIEEKNIALLKKLGELKIKR